MRLPAPLLLIVVMVLLYVPFNPHMPVARLDPSWAMALNELAARDALFGKEVIFTFGPLAAVYTAFFHPATDTVMLLASGLLAIAAIACWILILRGRSPWKWLGVALVYWLMVSSRDALLLSIPLLASLATAFWSIDQKATAAAKSKPLVRIASSAMLIFVWCVVGILPLIKGTMFAMSVALILLTTAFLVLEGRKVEAVLVLILPPAICLIAWQAAGQPIEGLPLYVSGLSELIKGYTDAMSNGLGKARRFIQLIMFVLLSGMLVYRSFRFGRERSLVFASYLVVVLAIGLFLAFKASFVRHDEGHAIIAMNLGLILVCVAFTRLKPARDARWKWLLVSGLMWYSVMDGMYSWSLAKHLPIWWHKQSATLSAMVNRIAKPQALPSAYQNSLARIRQQYPLPELEGSMDVYPVNHAVAIAHGPSWRPRPVLQSYSVYTPKLARINRDHLLGAQAPDWIWFSIDTIDGRMASLGDGASWPVLLRDYEPVESLAHGIILQRRRPVDVSTVPPPGNILIEQVASLGERIALPPGADMMTLSVDIHHNWLGKILHTAFKTRGLILQAELASGETRELRVISGMLVEDVILSPLIETSDEFRQLYGAPSLLAGKRVVAIRLVEDDKGPSQWQSNFHLTVRHADSATSQ